MNIGEIAGWVTLGAVGFGSGVLIPVLIRPWCSCPRWMSVFIPLVSAAVFMAMADRFDEPVAVLAYCVLTTGLIASTAVDIRTHRLPRRITYATLALGAPMLAVAAHVTGEDHRIRTAFLGASAALAIMGLLYVLSRGGLGDGDVRFSPLIGAYTGWSSLSDVADGLFLAFASGAIWGLTLVIVQRAGRKTALPFGPFLAAGALTAVLLPRQLVLF